MGRKPQPSLGITVIRDRAKVRDVIQLHLAHPLLRDSLELEVRRKQLVVRKASRPREGWEDRFRAMTERGDDRLLWADAALTRFDEKEWEW